MNNIEELVKRKKRENLILYLLLALFCILNIGFNIDAYKRVVFNEYYKITKLEDLKKEEKFFSIDLSKATKENYIVEFENKKSNIYTLNLDSKNVLIILKEGTVLTNDVIVEKEDREDLTNDIRLKFADIEYNEVTLSNIDFYRDRKIEKYKVYVLSALVAISILLSIISLIQSLNPKKTLMYKKMIKNKKY